MSKLPPLSKGKTGRKFAHSKSGAKVNYERPASSSSGARRRGRGS
jgi:hypothetical protein